MHFDIALAHPDEEPEQHCWYAMLQQTYQYIGGSLMIVRWFVKQEGLDMKLTPRVL